MRTRDLAIVDNPADRYQCFHCGPFTAFDANPMAPDDENTAMKVQENLKAAVANLWPRPFELGALAGTVACPQCAGAPRVRRLTPDFGKALGMEEGWDFKIAKRTGRRFFFPRDQPRDPGAPPPPAQRARQFPEYPAAPPAPIELPAPPPDKAAAKAEGAAGGEGDGFKVSHTSAFSLDDYVLNYASDDEEPRK